MLGSARTRQPKNLAAVFQPPLRWPTRDLDVWKAYLTTRFLANNASVLPPNIDQAVFDFYGTTLRGQPEQRPRWKRAVSTIENNLGEAVAAVYVDRHFPVENKAEMDKLVTNLRAAMRTNLSSLAWMGEETRLKAEEKLDKFNPKIGYPEEFESYDTLIIGDSALENAQAAGRWGLEDNIARLGTEPDRNEWFMTPQTVNAYYNPSYNEIVFPAILQPPFFNIAADPAVNYAIGGVIVEIGHGFDDQGSKYSGDGVLENWWTEDDRSAFEQSDALVAQYNGFCPLEEGEPCINGRLSLAKISAILAVYRWPIAPINSHWTPMTTGQFRLMNKPYLMVQPAISASSWPGPRYGVRSIATKHSASSF